MMEPENSKLDLKNDMADLSDSLLKAARVSKKAFDKQDILVRRAATFLRAISNQLAEQEHKKEGKS
jgi:hypothetical protein